MKFTRKQKEFIKFVKDECKKYGVKCDLRKGKYVKIDPNIKCSGFFDEKSLVTAMKNPNAFGVLAHEYCHLTQWVDKIPLWKKADKALTKVDEWLGGKPVRNIKKYLAIARDLELDNEKRTVKLLKKFGFDDMIEDYTRKANAYVHFYNYMLFTRKWSNPNNSPYNNKKVLSVMSSKFNMKYSEMTQKVKKVFESEGI
jgi:hypothetical protein